MTEAIAHSIEAVPQPEHISNSNSLVALHARLLIGGEALNPVKLDMSPIDSSRILTFSNRDYSPFELASLSERTRYWEGQNVSSQGRLSTWKHETENLFHSQINSDISARLVRFSRKSGVNFAGINHEEIDKLYSKYFQVQNEEIRVKNFVKDVLDGYMTNGVFDFQQLDNDLPAIKWLSNIFGKKSSEMIEHMIKAESQLLDVAKRQFLFTNVNTANRINTLSADETRILEFIQEGVLASRNVATVASSPTPQNQPTSWPANSSVEPIQQSVSSRAEFTRSISESLVRCGVNLNYVNPVPLGQGANHLVYEYNLPGEPRRVLKIAKAKSISTLTNDHNEERVNYNRAMRIFPRFTIGTFILQDPQSDFYCTAQDRVDGVPLTSRHSNDPLLMNQLREIVRLNRRQYQSERISLDFVGMPGFYSWRARQLGKLIFKKDYFVASNILIDEHNRLKIVDYEYFYRNKTATRGRRVKGFFGLIANRWAMKHYFGMDIKK